ncbi:MAG TPA: DUF4386 domain-containing protein [Candidatus Krumholzibacteria bacterium]|nr:DUF4386 domain-containing protein [Candidatus Krumholzibacteria bacterium]
MTFKPPELKDLIGECPSTHARYTAMVGLVMLAAGLGAGGIWSRLIVRSDDAVTASNLVAFEPLFDLGIVCTVVMMVAFLFYALFLYRLLRPIDPIEARTMLVLVAISLPIYLLNQVNQYAAFLSAAGNNLERMQFYLDVHRFGNVIAGVFFGLWLFPLGHLVYKSGFFPKFLGVLLMIGAPGYIILFLQTLLFPQSAPNLWMNPFLVLTHFSELALLLWLLVRGVNLDGYRARFEPQSV